jgi:hypothetical protein
MGSPYHTAARATDTGPICPDRVYPLSAFIRTSGISKTRLREARLMGLPLPQFSLGKREYVRGHEAIAWMEQLSARLAEVDAKSAK